MLDGKTRPPRTKLGPPGRLLLPGGHDAAWKRSPWPCCEVCLIGLYPWESSHWTKLKKALEKIDARDHAAIDRKFEEYQRQNGLLL
jgi:hypothetical protein